MSIYLFKNGFINSKSEILSSEVLTILNGTAGITKILQLLEERDEVKVIYDQVSSPTTTLSLSEAIWATIKKNNQYSDNNKIFPVISHFSNDGVASWYDLAVAIGEIGLELGILKKMAKVNKLFLTRGVPGTHDLRLLRSHRK